MPHIRSVEHNDKNENHQLPDCCTLRCKLFRARPYGRMRGWFLWSCFDTRHPRCSDVGLILPRYPRTFVMCVTKTSCKPEYPSVVSPGLSGSGAGWTGERYHHCLRIVTLGFPCHIKSGPLCRPGWSSPLSQGPAEMPTWGGSGADCDPDLKKNNRWTGVFFFFLTLKSPVTKPADENNSLSL